MAMILNKKDDLNDELSQRISADLRAKMAESSGVAGEVPDFAEDSAYVKDFQKTGRFSFVWVLLIAGVVVAGIVIGFNL